MIDELQLKAIEEWGERDIPREYGETVVALVADHRALTAQATKLRDDATNLQYILDDEHKALEEARATLKLMTDAGLRAARLWVEQHLVEVWPDQASNMVWLWEQYQTMQATLAKYQEDAGTAHDYMDKLAAESQALTAERDELKARVAALHTQLKEADAYADKLVDGLTGDILPKDVEVIKAANWEFAQRVFDLEHERDELKAQIAAQKETKKELPSPESPHLPEVQQHQSHLPP